MPGSLLAADSAMPVLAEGESSEQKLQKIMSYLYMLLEQLRYTLANLGADNFNSTELDHIGKTFTEPLLAMIKNAEGDISTIRAEAGKLSSKVTDVQENLQSEIQQTKEDILSAVTDKEQGLQSKIQQNAGSISSTVKRLNGLSSDFSTVKQTVEGLEVETSGGKTTISGDKIESGTISGSALKATLYEGQENSEGKLEMFYHTAQGNDEFPVGGVWLDTEGAGTGSENKFRMFVGTREGASPSCPDFSLKLQSAGDSSYQSLNGNIWVQVPSGKSVYFRIGSAMWKFDNSTGAFTQYTP